MDFIKAVKVAEVNHHLIGKMYKGGIIDEIIIFPTNNIEKENFFKEYSYTLNAQLSIVPYINSDVDLAVIIDKIKINENCLIYERFDSIQDVVKIIWETE